MIRRSGHETRGGTATLWLTALFAFACLAAAVLAERSHTVKTGDTLDEISREYDVTIKDIVEANSLTNPDRLKVGQTLVIPDGPNTPAEYVVQNGDTLGEIAQAHGSSIAAISVMNNITDPNDLSVGQTLLIPKSNDSRHYPLDPNLKAELDRLNVRSGWRYIVIHHSAVDQGTVAGMDRYHRQTRRMKNGLAYHFVIGNGRGIPDGKIEVGNRWKGQLAGGHLASESLNQISIGICLVGNFDKTSPSQAQMRSLYALVQYLNRRCNLAGVNVKTHREINTRPTRCPGKNFPVSSLRQNI